MKTLRIYIPPNGFLGQGQQTHANQLVPAASGLAKPARKRKKKARGAKRATTARKSGRTTRRKKTARPARLVKGSAAAKRYMAKIRRKRKK